MAPRPIFGNLKDLEEESVFLAFLSGPGDLIGCWEGGPGVAPVIASFFFRLPCFAVVGEIDKFSGRSLESSVCHLGKSCEKAASV